MDTRLVIVKNGMTYLNLHIAVVVIAALISPKLAVLSAILVLISVVRYTYSAAATRSATRRSTTASERYA